MILNNNNTKIDTNINDGVTAFNINQSPIAFKILSSNLYSNAIGSIVRELSSNAYDSHVAAHKEHVPFKVHAPSVIEPYFSIRDYGKGLTDEEIMGVKSNINGVDVYSNGIYNSYFKSTKNDSDDYVGGYGLGAKSPFSYVDTFNITSIVGGMQRSYITFINDNGVPSIAFMSLIETDDDDGVIVNFNVNPNDIDTFCDEISKAYIFYKTPPTIVGIVNEPPKPRKLVIASLNYDIHECTIGNPSKFTIAYNNVPYTIHKRDINNFDDHTKKIFKLFNFLDITLYVNVSDIDVTTSREDIKFTDKTISNISRMVYDIYLGIIKYVEDDITDNIGEYQSYLKIEKMLKNLNKRCDLISVLNHMQSEKDISNIMFKKCIESKNTIHVNFRYHSIEKYLNDGSYVRQMPDNKFIYPTENCEILYNDTLKTINKLTTFMSVNKVKECILITKIKQKDDNNKTKINEELKTILHTLNGGKLVKTSEKLNVDPVAISTNTHYSLIIHKGKIRKLYSSEVEELLSSNSKLYYVPLHRNQPAIKDDLGKWDTFNKDILILRNYKKIFNNIQSLYGIHYSHYEEIKSDERHVNFIDTIIQFTKENKKALEFNNTLIRGYHKDIKHSDIITYNWVNKNRSVLSTMISTMAQNSIFRTEITDILKQLVDNDLGITNINYISAFGSIYIHLYGNTYEAPHMNGSNKILDKYPMLEYLIDYRELTEFDVGKISTYINTLDMVKDK